MHAEQPALLAINHLSVEYPTPTGVIRAVDDISLSLRAGETVGLIGESGSGKSSLALASMGLINQGRTQGEIRYDGQNLLALTESAWRTYRWKDIALVFQNALEVLNPVLTVGEQVAEPLRLHTSDSAEIRAQNVQALFELVGLDPRWRQAYPHELSGGMRQKALFAMALACQPKVLLIDEPTAALDAESRQDFLRLLLRLQHQQHCAMLVISHDLTVIKRLTTRVLVMYAGQILEMGATDQTLKEPAHCYTRGLLQASPGFFKYKDLWGIAGEPPRGGIIQGCPFAPRCCQAEATCQTTRPPLVPTHNNTLVACHKGGIETFLHAAGVSKTYQRGQRSVAAVNHVDLVVKSGETAALIGKTGSGKSTLAHVLAGVVPGDSGDIYYRQKRVSGHWATSMIGGMQIVFQDPFAAISQRMTVLDAVKEPLDILHWESKDQRIERACALLHTVQLPTTAEFSHSCCYTLSGGQRQRVALARALITQPKLLIADEITSMLDPSTQANILRELKTLQQTAGFALLYITHDVHIARKIADKVYVMYDGKIVEHGVATDVFEHPRQVYTKNLLQAAFTDFA